MIVIKKEEEIEKMREAGRITALILREMAERIKPGVSAYEINEYAERRLEELKAVPAFKNYPHPSGGRKYPASVCISVNEEVVHGIPTKEKVFREGDIVSLDFGVLKNGYYGDSALTVGLEPLSHRARQLIKTTREALYQGIKKAVAGAKLGDISHAVQSYVERRGFSVVRDFVGHGVGRKLHEEPQVPNYRPYGKTPVLKAGMTLAIEPMVNAGVAKVRVLADGWTVITADRKRSAHYEHTVLVTDGDPEILTWRPREATPDLLGLGD